MPEKPNFSINATYFGYLNKEESRESRVQSSKLVDPSNYSTQLLSLGKTGAFGLLRRG